MDPLRRGATLFIAGCLLLAACAARGQSNSVSINLANLTLQGEVSHYISSLPFHINQAPAYVFSITGSAHGEGPIYSRLFPASEPISTIFESLHSGLSAYLQGSVSNPGATFPATVLNEKITSGTDGIFKATFTISMAPGGEVDFSVTDISFVVNKQPDTTDIIRFDAGTLNVTALYADVSITTLPATNVGIHSATMNASLICPNPSQVSFLFGSGTSLSGTSGMVSVPATGSAQTVSTVVRGLLPHQVYQFKAVGQDVTGPTYGRLGSLQTADTPPVAGAVKAYCGLAPLPIPVLASCADADGDRMRVMSVSRPAAGVAQVGPGGGSVLYKFTSRTTGSDQFLYTISDGFGGSGTGQVTVFNIAPMAGTYGGILRDSGGAAGGFVRVQLGATGVATGALTFDGTTYRVGGTFDGSGHFGQVIAVPDTPYGAQVSLDITPAGSGYLLAAGLSRNMTRLSALLPPAAPIFSAGYTLLLPAPAGAGYRGSGFATVGVGPGGLVNIIGELPDGGKFSSATVVDGSGRIGFFTPLYAASNPGNLSGVLAITGTARTWLAGGIQWNKPIAAAAPLIPGPLSLQLSGSGAAYVRPVASGTALQFGTPGNFGNLLVTGGNLVSDYNGLAAVAAGSKVQVLGQGGVLPSFTINPASGVISGKLVDPDSQNVRTLRGIIIQPRAVAAGYFEGDSETGAFKISR